MFLIIMACVILGVIDLMCGKIGLAIAMLLTGIYLVFVDWE